MKAIKRVGDQFLSRKELALRNSNDRSRASVRFHPLERASQTTGGSECTMFAVARFQE